MYSTYNAVMKNYRQIADFMSEHSNAYKMAADLLGYTQMRNTEKSTQAQIDYEEYLKQGNERALSDWNRFVGWQGKKIQYPELSYPGQIYRSNTAIARAGFDYANASANYFGNLPYRVAGLYGIGGKLSRTL